MSFYQAPRILLYTNMRLVTHITQLTTPHPSACHLTSLATSPWQQVMNLPANSRNQRNPEREFLFRLFYRCRGMLERGFVFWFGSKFSVVMTFA